MWFEPPRDWNHGGIIVKDEVRLEFYSYKQADYEIDCGL